MDEIVLGQPLSDAMAMAMAIEEAKKGWGSVSPNPAVGCCILDNNNCLLSVGYHQRYGDAHAEINALRGIPEERLVGARVFVTLEPCAHHGKTPPCAEALAKLPLKEVIFGLFDPNPLVKGRGAAIIAAAGIKTTHYPDAQDALEEVCEHFLKNMRTQLPFVSIKVAMSIDGQIALKNGQSQWITGPEAQLSGHFLRATHDAMLVGVDTFLCDDPTLTIRHPDFPEKRNRVIVVDPHGRGIPHIKSSRLFLSHHPDEIIWVVSGASKISDLHSLPVPSLRIATKEEFSAGLDLTVLKQELFSLGLRSILVEGGAKTISQFINQKAADRLYVYVAPKIVGSNGGLSWTAGLPALHSLQQAIPLKSFEMSTHGKDSLLTARFL